MATHPRIAAIKDEYDDARMFDFLRKTEGNVGGQCGDSHDTTLDDDGKESAAANEVPGGHKIGVVHRPKVIKVDEGMKDGAAEEGKVER